MEIKILKIKQGRKRPEICIEWGTFRERQREFWYNMHRVPIIHSKDYTWVTYYP